MCLEPLAAPLSGLNVTVWRKTLQNPNGGRRLPAQDAASALLGAQVGADMLLLLTDAPAVFDPARWPAERVPVRSPVQARELLASGDFARGSMGPKVWAFLDFCQMSVVCLQILRTAMGCGRFKQKQVMSCERVMCVSGLLVEGYVGLSHRRECCLLRRCSRRAALCSRRASRPE